MAKQIANAELKVEFLQKLIDVQQTALTLQEENTELKERIKNWENADALREQFFHAHTAYWQKGESPPHPYCTGCLDDKGKAVRLSQHLRQAICPVCKAVYRDVFGHRPQPPEE